MHPCKWWAHPCFENQNNDRTKFLICHLVKNNQKSKYTSLLHMYAVHVASYATVFDETFLVDVSIYRYIVKKKHKKKKKKKKKEKLRCHRL